MVRGMQLRIIRVFIAEGVAELVERLFPNPEVCGLNPAIGKIYIERLMSTLLKRRK